VSLANGPTDVSTVMFGRVAGNPVLLSSTNGALGTNLMNLGYTPSIQIIALPEPGTYGLMALGLAGLAVAARRR